MNKKTVISGAQIILAGILWGTIGIFVNTLSGFGFNSYEIIAVRCFFTAVCLFIFLFIKDRNLLKIRLSHIWYFIGTGICSFMFFNICYLFSIQANGMSVASVLLYTAPAFVCIMSAIFFKERLTIKKLSAVAAAFCGCALVSGVGAAQSMTINGLLLGLGAGFGYALYSIFACVALKKYSSFTVTAYTFLFACAGIIPFLNFGEFFGKVSAFPDCIWLLLLLGLVTNLIPYISYTSGLAGVSPGAASVMASVEPLVATLLGVLIYSEQLTLFGIAGMGLIVLSIVVLNVGKSN